MKFVCFMSFFVLAIFINESESRSNDGDETRDIQLTVNYNDMPIQYSLIGCEGWTFAKNPTFDVLEFRKKEDGKKKWVFVKIKVNEKDKPPRYTQAVLYREYGSVYKSDVKYLGKKDVQTKDAPICVDIERCYYDRLAKKC